MEKALNNKSIKALAMVLLLILVDWFGIWVNASHPLKAIGVPRTNLQHFQATLVGCGRQFLDTMISGKDILEIIADIEVTVGCQKIMCVGTVSQLP